MYYSLAQLTGLPGLPTADRELRKLATTWDSRPRANKGGGLEYHIESLPRHTQDALKHRELLKRFPFPLEAEYHGGDFPERGVLFEAKLWALQALEQFCLHHSLTKTYGRELFIQAYNHALFNIPNRVKSLLDNLSIGTLDFLRKCFSYPLIPIISSIIN